MSQSNDSPPIDRSFVRIADGLMHLRHAGQSSAEPPLWMMHAAPASSRSLEPLLAALAARRRVIAPDTPGYGDSAALSASDPALTDYATAMLRMLDALGIDTVDLYGFHTGAHIAVEMALAAPQRVRRVVLDGLLVLDDAEREEFLAHYAPPVQPDAAGLQFAWAVNYIRDQAWFFPHFRRDAAHNLGQGAMSAEVLHYLVTELLKAVGTYHLGYRAVFRHRVVERVAALSQPTLLTADASDPTRAGLRELVAACPRLHCDLLQTSTDPARTPGKAQRIDAFLLSPPAPPGSRT
ncbi:MAG: alpha/beta hydrolase [Steroidobacteraceae bacterium]